MPASSRSDPYGRHRFHVEIEGIIIAGFTNVAGMHTAISNGHRRLLEERNDDDQIRPQPQNPFRPDKSKSKPAVLRDLPHTLRLTRGITEDTQLWEWFEAWRNQKGKKRSVLISLMNDAGEGVVIWQCQNAFPVAYYGPELNAQEPGVAFETYELQYSDLLRRTTNRK